MYSSKTRDLIELAGILSIVASLIFVGMQLRLDQRTATGAAYQSRAEARIEDIRLRMEIELSSNDFENRIARGDAPRWWSEEVAAMQREEEIPAGELIRTYQRRSIDLLHLDNLVFQHSLGLIQTATLESVFGVWRGGAEDPIARAAIGTGRIHPDTIVLLKELGFRF